MIRLGFRADFQDTPAPAQAVVTPAGFQLHLRDAVGHFDPQRRGEHPLHRDLVGPQKAFQNIPAQLFRVKPEKVVPLLCTQNRQNVRCAVDAAAGHFDGLDIEKNRQGKDYSRHGQEKEEQDVVEGVIAFSLPLTALLNLLNPSGT